MSIPVALTELRDTAARYRFAYLLTVTDDGGAHAVAVQPVWSDAGELVIGDLGRRTTANAGARTNVTLVWPPLTMDEYSLIVDGRASVDGDTVRLVPGKAVLHRPAPANPDAAAGSCGSDCVAVPVTGA